jgi:NAD(P)-dependent dehydrogenase (short-subunit alcohol dehydrogenase family)
MRTLEGQNVLVVGGSSGMGQAIAAAAAAQGAHVTIASRSVDKLEAAAKAIGLGVQTRQLDVNDEAAVKSFFAGAASIDHLVMTSHASSVVSGAITSLSAMTVEAARAFMETKFWGPFVLVKYALPLLAERASVTFFSGAAGPRKLLPDHTAIGATNGAVEAFARQLSKELAPRRVNTVAAGLVKTPTYDTMPAEARDAMYAGYARNALVGRVGEPEDIAHAVLYLMTNHYVTGTILEVDGGRP